MGRPPPSIIRAMPERKRFFSVDPFPKCKTRFNSQGMILNGSQKIIFQNRYVALETPSRPPPFFAKANLNFHFDYLNPSLIQYMKHFFKEFYNRCIQTKKAGVYSLEVAIWPVGRDGHFVMPVYGIYIQGVFKKRTF